MKTDPQIQFAPSPYGFAPLNAPLSSLIGADEKGGLVIRALHGGKLSLQHGDLLRAAPDLLAALKRIVEVNGSTGGPASMVAEFKHIAAQAIAKATR